MPTDTAQGRQPEPVVQFSAFTRNRLGRLHDLVGALGARGVHVIALTVLDTTECAIIRFVADDPDLTLTINRTDLEQTMMGAKELEKQIADGTCKAEGDLSILKKLASTMIEFDPRFEVLPGTKLRGTEMADANPYEAVPGVPCAE